MIIYLPLLACLILLCMGKDRPCVPGIACAAAVIAQAEPPMHPAAGWKRMEKG